MRWSDTVPPGERRFGLPSWAPGLAFAFVVFGLLGAIALPDFVGMNTRALSSEVNENVDRIVTAELSYDAAFDVFVPTTVAPRPVRALDKHLAEWTGGESWSKLGWAPDGQVRGTYWVETGPDQQAFTVHGVIDADGDGDIREVVVSYSHDRPNTSRVEIHPGEL